MPNIQTSQKFRSNLSVVAKLQPVYVKRQGNYRSGSLYPLQDYHYKTAEEILNLLVFKTGISKVNILSKSRDRRFARARVIFVVILAQVYPEISKEDVASLINRDHAMFFHYYYFNSSLFDRINDSDLISINHRHLFESIQAEFF